MKKEDLSKSKLETSSNLLMNYSYLKETMKTSNLRMSSFQLGEYDINIIGGKSLDLIDRNQKDKKSS